jgi:hypothetical protein
MLGLHRSTWASNFINNWIEKLKIDDFIKLEINPLPDFHLNQVRLVNSNKTKRKYLVDFGYGTLQLITILIKIIVEVGKNEYSRYNIQYSHYNIPYEDVEEIEGYMPHVILIEEPETNLHPNWQSILAKIFLDASKQFNTQFIIETHSEYLIRSFQSQIGAKEVNNDGLILYYINDLNRIEAGAKQVEKIDFDEDGAIDYKLIGEGFFDEHYSLKLSLLNIRRNNFITGFEAIKNKIATKESTILQLEDKIDDYTQKLELTEYQLLIDDLLGGADNRSKLSPESYQFFASAKFMFAIFEHHVDYSPIVIQCGRVVENELMNIFKPYRNYIKSLPSTSPSIYREAENIIDSASGWFIDMEPKSLVLYPMVFE